LIGEIDYAVEPYKEDYKNTPSRDWLDSSSVFREKEASLLLSQRERIDNHFYRLGRGLILFSSVALSLCYLFTCYQRRQEIQMDDNKLMNYIERLRLEDAPFGKEADRIELLQAVDELDNLIEAEYKKPKSERQDGAIKYFTVGLMARFDQYFAEDR
jgi:hypothetical protein